MNNETSSDKPLLTDLTISEAQAAFGNGTLTSEALVKACFERIEQGQELNIFVTLNHEQALAAAREVDRKRQQGETVGPLGGIPVVIKDNLHTKDLMSCSASPAFDGYVPSQDAQTVQKLRDAGAVILGKTNMHELAFGATGYNPAYNTGPGTGVRNPYDSGRIAGGSSSGSAAALAARMALGSLGTDTGGSMRIPPALNGVAGLRPTWGRYSGEGVIPIAETRDTVGPMALSMADLALLDAVITDDFSLPSIQLKELRLGLPEEFWQNMDDDTADLMAQTLDTLRAHGVTLVDVGHSGLMELNEPVGFPVVVAEAYTCMNQYLARYHPQMSIEDVHAGIASPDVKMIYKEWVLDKKTPTKDGLVDVAPLYQAAMNGGRDRLRERYEQLYLEHQLDALAFPTTPVVAPPANDDIYLPQNFEKLIQNTEPSSSAGTPGLQIPVGLGSRSGMPVGLELDGPMHSDRRLLAIGLVLESILGRVARA